MLKRTKSGEALDALRESDAAFVRPADVAPVMGVEPYSLNWMARGEGLPFAFFFSGNRLKISRESFLHWYKGGPP